MKILYVIPARGGSKGLPGKNIRILGGKPLIAYSIIAAQNSKFSGQILVSTDDAEISTIAKQFGADVPFVRPAELSNDAASTIDVIFHAIDYYKEQNILFDIVAVLQPTSPLRISADIDNAILLMQEKNADAIVSVCESEHHPLWANTLKTNGSMKGFMRDEIKGKNRQQLPIYYRLNGAIYISKVDVLEKQKSFIHDESYAYVMPPERSVDIDYEIDFKLAELLLK